MNIFVLRLRGLLGLSALSLSLCLCSPAWAQFRNRARPSEAAAPATFTGLPLSQLKGVESGAGLVTCEPVVPAGFPAELADFGAGCSRWLQFAVGGQGALGKTPLWSEVDRAQLELSRPNLRCNIMEAAQLQPLLGVTHGVVGTLEGTSEQLTLTYHLWQFTPRKEVGEPLTLRGTRQQILAQLPTVAATLCHRLNVKNPHLSDAPLAAPDDMAFMGKTAALSGFLHTPAIMQRLYTLARQCPLAGMLLLRSDVLAHTDPRVTSEISQQLLEQTPENTLAYGQVAKRERLNLLAAGAEIKNLARRFPYNYAVAIADFYWQSASENTEEAVRAVDRAAQSNIASPYAWLHVSYAMAALAEEDRSDSSSAAQNEQQAAQQAVHLDPQNWYLWMQAMRASTRAGKSEEAEAAVQKMLAYDRADPDVIPLALSIYGAQSPADKAKRAQVAQHAVSARYLTAYQSNAVAATLQNYGFPEQSKTVYARAFEQLRAMLAETPDNRETRVMLAAGLWNAERWDESLLEYKKLTELNPTDARLFTVYGSGLYQRHLLTEAIRALDTALRIAPNYAPAFTLLGRCLLERGEVERAEQQFSAALRYDPRISEAHYGLGRVRSTQGRYEEAATEYQAVLDTLRTSWSAKNAQEIMRDSYIHLSEALCATGKLDSALEAAQSALQISPQNIEALNQLSAAYQKRKDWDKSIVVLTRALRLKPTDAATHENMGNALIEKGQRLQARAEWKKALTLDTGKIAEEARKMLARYPE